MALFIKSGGNRLDLPVVKSCCVSLSAKVLIMSNNVNCHVTVVNHNLSSTVSQCTTSIQALIVPLPPGSPIKGQVTNSPLIEMSDFKGRTLVYKLLFGLGHWRPRLALRQGVSHCWFPNFLKMDFWFKLKRDFGFQIQRKSFHLPLFNRFLRHTSRTKRGLHSSL